MFSHFTSRCGLWYWHPQIHPDGAWAALRHGTDWGPVQVHLLVSFWVHTDPQGHRQRLPGEQQNEELAFSCGWATGRKGQFQEKSILMCRSIDLCNLTAVDHFNVNRICYQSSTCERWTLTHRQTDKKKKICHIDKTSRRTSLRLSHSPAYLTCLCLFFRQETETEYGNLPLKCQPVTKKASKWVGLSLCMSLCVNRTWMHSQGSSTLLTAALLFISWLSQHLQSHVCSCILDRGPAVGGKMHCICI